MSHIPEIDERAIFAVAPPPKAAFR